MNHTVSKQYITHIYNKVTIVYVFALHGLLPSFICKLILNRTSRWNSGNHIFGNGKNPTPVEQSQTVFGWLMGTENLLPFIIGSVPFRAPIWVRYYHRDAL